MAVLSGIIRTIIIKNKYQQQTVLPVSTKATRAFAGFFLFVLADD